MADKVFKMADQESEESDVLIQGWWRLHRINSCVVLDMVAKRIRRMAEGGKKDVIGML